MATPFGSGTSEARAPVGRTVLALRLLAWVVGLGAGLVLLHDLGGGQLAPPPASPDAWSDWWQSTDPSIAAMALLRVVVVGLGWYLLAATSLGLLAHLSRSVLLWRVAELLTARLLHRVVGGVVGVALVSMGSAPAAAAPSLRGSDPPTPVALHLVAQEADEPDPDEPNPDEPDPDDADTPARDSPQTEGARPESDEGEADSGLERFRLPGGAFRDAGSGRAPVPEPAAGEHLVAAGESFWRIAAGRLERAGQPTDDRAVERYWRVLIEANHDRLVVEGEPDLILPGQRLRLPPVPATVGSEVAP